MYDTKMTISITIYYSHCKRLTVTSVFDQVCRWFLSLNWAVDLRAALVR
jgi:hypothetical protein